MEIAGKSHKTILFKAPGNILVLFLSAYIVVMPNINVLPDQEPYNTKRIFELLLIIGAGFGVIFLPKWRWTWLSVYSALPKQGRWILGGIMIGGLLSATMAPYRRFAFLEVGHMALLGVLILLFAGGWQKRPYKATRIILGVLGLSVGFYVLGFAVVHADNVITHGNRLWPSVSHIGFSHIRFFNQYQTWTLPLIPLLILLVPRSWKAVQIIALTVLACWWMLLIAAGGRGTVVAVVGSIVVTGIIFHKKAWPWIKWQCLGTVGGFLLYGILFVYLPNAESIAVTLPGTEAGLLTRDLSNTNSRLLYWQTALELASEDHLLGAGPMQYAVSSNRAAHPHNALMQWLAEWGIPSTLALLGIAIWGMWAWVRQCKKVISKQPKPHVVWTRVALSSALFAGLAHALVSGILIMPLSQVLLVVIIGWTLGLFVEEKNGGKRRKKKELMLVGGQTQILLVLFMVGAIILVVWGTIPDLFLLVDRQSFYLQESGGHWLLPRYWQQGFIDFYP